MDPSKLRRQADHLEAQADALFAEGKHEQALKLYAAADLYRRTADELSRGTQRGNRRGMVQAQRVRVSEGIGARDELVEVANEANHTLRSLAEAVTERLKGDGITVTHSLLSQARRGKKKIQEKAAQAVEDLTRSEKYPRGFQATRRNWPKGWV